jgi:hypothetical protein
MSAPIAALRGVTAGRAERLQRLRFGRCAVLDPDGVPRLQHMLDHPPAHDA